MKEFYYSKTADRTKNIWVAAHIVLHLAVLAILGFMVAFLFTDPDHAAPLLLPFAVGYVFGKLMEEADTFLRRKAGLDSAIDEIEHIWSNRVK